MTRSAQAKRIARKIQEEKPNQVTRIAYGVMDTATTVFIEDATTAVPVPQDQGAGVLAAGDYVWLAITGADTFIGGKVAATPAAVSTITAATNFTVTGLVYPNGTTAGVSVTVTRINSNVAATTAVVGTFDAAGRGSFNGYTQALAHRAASASALADARCWIDISTGQVSMQWLNTWNIGVSATFNGVVLFDR